MKKKILIALVVIVAAVAIWYFTLGGNSDCPPPRNPNKFPEPWMDDNRNSGELFRLAQKYADPILGGDAGTNGSIVGGFFKGIDVYPSAAAATYYQKWLIDYLNSSNALPWWNIEQGELLC